MLREIWGLDDIGMEPGSDLKGCGDLEGAGSQQIRILMALRPTRDIEYWSTVVMF